MPHTVASIVGSTINLVNGLYETTLAYDAANPVFVNRILSVDALVAGPVTAGSNKVVSVADASLYTVGDYVEIREGSDRDFTSIVARDTGADTITLKTLANGYTIAAEIYKLTLQYEQLLIVDTDPLVTEITALSFYGPVRDQMALRAVYAAMSDDEFDRMEEVLELTLVGGDRAEKIDNLYTQLIAIYKSRSRASGPGIINPADFSNDRGAYVSFALSSFDDQFEEVDLNASFDEFSFEAPFDMFLRKATVFTNESDTDDAYVTITKNDVTTIVGAGDVPPDRNLPAVTGVQKSVDIDNHLVAEGDKITVRLVGPTLNTVLRCKVTIGYAARLISIP